MQSLFEQYRPSTFNEVVGQVRRGRVEEHEVEVTLPRLHRCLVKNLGHRLGVGGLAKNDGVDGLETRPLEERITQAGPLQDQRRPGQPLKDANHPPTRRPTQNNPLRPHQLKAEKGVRPLFLLRLNWKGN